MPESTITPPIDVPCPPINFVAECTTISAPKSNGLTKYGVPKVLSTINGILCSWAIFAIASISAILITGFPIVSIYKAFVFSFIALLKFSGLSQSTNVVLIPNLGRVVANKLNVPHIKYSLLLFHLLFVRY